jgi:hypothetical protein
MLFLLLYVSFQQKQYEGMDALHPDTEDEDTDSVEEVSLHTSAGQVFEYMGILFIFFQIIAGRCSRFVGKLELFATGALYWDEF